MKSLGPFGKIIFLIGTLSLSLSSAWSANAPKLNEQNSSEKKIQDATSNAGAAEALSSAKPEANSESKSQAVPGQKSIQSGPVQFDEILIQGRFNSAQDAVTTVEDDKLLDALLSVRKNFDDRLELSQEQM